jgi:hypothetical protein
VTDDDIAAMERDVAAVNFKRQTGSIRNYTFGIYFNIVAANMTTDGGWMPYVAEIRRFLVFLLAETFFTVRNKLMTSWIC